jgi:Fur family transcriptional regulator, zinc uptake regulator
MTALGRNDQQVLAALRAGGRPMSAYDILDKVRSDSLKAPVQVYRSLAKLGRMGLAHRVEALNAFVACSDRREGLHRPGFVVCRDCGTVQEFEDARMANIARKAAGPDFSIELISMEIFGRCPPCVEGGGEASS